MYIFSILRKSRTVSFAIASLLLNSTGAHAMLIGFDKDYYMEQHGPVVKSKFAADYHFEATNEIIDGKKPIPLEILENDALQNGRCWVYSLHTVQTEGGTRLPINIREIDQINPEMRDLFLEIAPPHVNLDADEGRALYYLYLQVKVIAATRKSVPIAPFNWVAGVTSDFDWVTTVNKASQATLQQYKGRAGYAHFLQVQDRDRRLDKFISNGRSVRNLPKDLWPFLQDTDVHTVDLSFNNIGDEEARNLGYYLQGTQVRTVDLHGNNISDEGARDFAALLPGTPVTTVRLSGNNISDAGARDFAVNLQGTQVRTVDLSDNNIGDEGARDFAAHLQGTQVRTVDLSFNEIGDAGAREFAAHLQGAQVLQVVLWGNNIGDEGARDFAANLQETHVAMAYLWFNFKEISKYVQEELMHNYPNIRWEMK